MPRRLALVLTLAACGGPGADAAPPDPPPGDGSPQGGGDAPPCLLVRGDRGPAGDTPLTVEVVAEGLEVPWSVAFLPDGGLLVTERPGRLRRITPEGRLVEAPVLTVEVAGGGEGGLLGLALHPDFAANRAFYLYETADGGATNRVVRYELSPDGRAATRRGVVLDEIPGARFHNGGRLRFGPDGMLYVGTGDARDGALSQDPASLAGKLLRVAPDGSRPADAPIPGSLAWVTGVRNTQGFDWTADGRLVLSDHGPSGERGRQGHDEVSLPAPGANLGWPDVIGCEARAGRTTPIVAWEQATPPGGLAVVTGGALPSWQGDVVVAVLGFGDEVGHLHRLVLGEDGRVVRHEQHLRGAWGRLRDVVQGPDGALYVTTSNCDGRGACPPERDRVLRIVEAR